MKRPAPRMFRITFTLACMMALTAPAFAATISVNTTDDELNSDGDCSLREAIQAANTNNIVSGCVRGENTPVIDEIVIPAGTYTLTLPITASADNNDNQGGDLDIAQSALVRGATGNAADVVIQAGAAPFQGIDRVFHVTAGLSKTVTFRYVTVQNGCASGGTCGNGGGGGIEINTTGTVNVENSVIQGNQGNAGGGLHPYSGGALQVNVTDVACQGNRAGAIGGCISSHNNSTITRSLISGNSAVNAANGGGVGVPNGTTRVIDSLITGNTTLNNGGGVTVQGLSGTSFGSFVATNTTISGNQANMSGGGLYVNGGVGGTNVGPNTCSPSPCSAILNNVTLSNNTADNDNGGAAGNGGGVSANGTGAQPAAFQSRNSIIAGNLDRTGASAASHDVDGRLTSQNYNLIGNVTGLVWASGQGSGDLTGVSASLGALADNGGATRTHALPASSLAVDAGNPAGCANESAQALTADQRGIGRPQNGRCDIGAFELEITAACGNGAVEAGEQCDDNNTASGDGCSSTCQTESVCGNGLTQPGEQCDDNNTAGGDGCSPTCQFETGACDDGNACTTGEAWSSGVCGGGLALACSDGNACTTDSCNPASGCVYANNTDSCDDGNACTTGDSCAAGACAGVAPLNCDDGNGCTDDSCNPASGCAHSNNTASCDDGNACTPNDQCAGGSCGGSGSVCGNGTVNASCGEQCDDGNTASGDGCSATCQTEDPEEECGNGVLETGEECDDHNTQNGDGCSATCQAESVCGNQMLEDGEECDDGNTASGDCCNSLCAFEPSGSSCDDSNTCTATDACSAGVCSGSGSTCGNGTVDGDCSEQCDDGGTASGDGCSATCQEEYCGDGSVNNAGAEECDDSNVINGDGCDAGCQTEVPADPLAALSDPYDGSSLDAAWTNFPVSGGYSSYTVANGSLNMETPSTFMNPWFQNATGPMLYKSVNSRNFKVTARLHMRRKAPNESQPMAAGAAQVGGLVLRNPNLTSPNHIVMGMGDMDWSTTNNLQLLNSSTVNGTGLFTNYNRPWLTTPDAEIRVCRLDANFRMYARAVGSSSWELLRSLDRADFPEQVQVGTSVFTTTTARDTRAVFDGIEFATAMTEADCLSDAASTAPVCGNGAVEAGEQCDDNNTANGDGCSSTCQNQPIAVCGNGVTEAGEQCDGGACCNGSCQFAVGAACSDGNACTAVDACNASGACAGSGSVCGNGTVESACNEQCDDSNTASGDGCDSGCRTEIPPGPVCGNGSVESGEQCDDSNTVSGDGCTGACQNEYCGDGTVNDAGAEECDDANTADGDGCDSDCAVEETQAQCGNDSCEEGESAANCPADCDGPNLRLQSSASPVFPSAGQTVVLTLTYSNTGNAPATGVVITADIPMTAGGFSAPASAPTVWSCADGTPSGNLCATTIAGTLAPGATGTVRFAVTYPATSRIYQTSTIRDDGTHGNDPDITDNGASFINSQSYKSINLGPTRAPANISHMLVPASYDGFQPLPLVVMMHGLDSQSYSGQLDGLFNYRFSEAVQTRGYFLLLGKGTGSIHSNTTTDPYTPARPRPHWNATDACCSNEATSPVGQLTPASDVNDVAYLRGMIEEAQDLVRVDANRIYAMGFSNGAFMSYRLACEMPEVLAAIAPISGVTYQNEASCAGTEPVSVLHINGTADVSIPFYDVTYTLDPDNNPATTNVTIMERPNIPGAEETTRRWAAKAGCDLSSSLLPNVDFVLQHNMANITPAIVVGAGNETIVRSYDNCDPGYNVELWEVPLWGHGGYYNGSSNPTAATRILDWLFAHPKAQQ